jgi:hypothetical protein
MVSMDEILETLHDINKRLENIEKHMGILEKDCSKMSEHIRFVEKTYDMLRGPLGYLKNKVDYLTGASRVELPPIKEK